MLDTDENVVEYLEEHFKDVRVSCEPRPDGALLVTLRNNQGKRLMSRAISGQEQSSPLLLNQVLERIRRDLIIDQGPLQTRDSDYFRKRIDLNRLKSYSIWNAHYNVAGSPIACDMWQGTCTARIPGYGGQIDVNISYVG